MDKKIILFAVILVILELLIAKIAKSRRNKNRDYSNDYQRKLLLTKNEWKNYMSIRPFLDKERLLICPKVRLLDLVEPRKGSNSKQYQILLNKVQSKHVDFTICDEMLNVLLILELDDSSHDADARKERDRFIDSVLTGSGYRVLHVRSFEDEFGTIQTAINKARSNQRK